jgi:hypothetical protein
MAAHDQHVRMMPLDRLAQHIPRVPLLHFIAHIRHLHIA